ncbi:ATP-binding protein [Photobacterium frigidiphilum]|uniref:ATP-binding protein n=1 Tax=Photobacterium frigidiphilum TaxID=264736 RepID=UPI003D097F6D
MSKDNAVTMEDLIEQLKPEQNLRVDDKGNAYVLVRNGASTEAILINLKNKKFKKLIRKVARKLGSRLKSADIDELAEELESMAWDFEETPIAIEVRNARSQDKQSVLIDLCNAKGEIVALSAGNVEVLDKPNTKTNSVVFSRPECMKPMVTPEITTIKGGLKKLQPFINTDQTTFFELVGYMTYVMAHPKACGVPYPILLIQGEKGSGKSFFSNNVMRTLLDPSSLDGLRMPKREQDFAIQVNSMFLGVYDNLRKLTKDQSDMLCTTATKGNIASRTLYSNDGLTSLLLHAPLLLNGIHNFVTESDLASRCFKVALVPMAENKCKPEGLLKQELDDALPEIFGSLLTLASKALVEEKNAEVIYPARMMDFAKWLAAIETVLKVGEGKLQKAYRANVKNIMASGTEDDSLTVAMQKLIKSAANDKIWKATPSRLLETLQFHENPMYLPRGAAALTSKLKAQESSLNANGVYFKLGRDTERFVMVSGKPLAA